MLAPLIAFLRETGTPEARVPRYAAFAAALYVRGCDLGAYLLDAALTDDNAYIRALAAGNTPPAVMAESVQRELRLFEALSRLDPAVLAAHAGVPPTSLARIANTPADFVSAYDAQAKAVRTRGYGIYARYGMFRLQDGRIAPIEHADPISLDALVGYERERQQVIDTRARSSRGARPRTYCSAATAGTGKSSTVKAVANRFFCRWRASAGAAEEPALLLPSIMGELSGNPLRFILFIDDLSFQKNDDSFGELKAILEGSAAAKAPNVVIYATSNRRHLVKETFSEREGDDVHRQDTMQGARVAVGAVRVDGALWQAGQGAVSAHRPRPGGELRHRPAAAGARPEGGGLRAAQRRPFCPRRRAVYPQPALNQLEKQAARPGSRAGGLSCPGAYGAGRKKTAAGRSPRQRTVCGVPGSDLVAREARHAGKALGQFLIGWNIVGHLAVVIAAIGDHVEIPCTGQAEHDGLGLARLAALERLVDRHADGMAALRRGQRPLGAREQLRRLEHLRLPDARGLHVAVVIQLRQNGAHAVIAQAAGMVRRRNEPAAERIQSSPAGRPCPCRRSRRRTCRA